MKSIFNKKLCNFALILLLILLVSLFGCSRSDKQSEGSGSSSDTSEKEEFSIQYESGAEQIFGFKPDRTRAAAGETVTLSENRYLRFGYSFAGWSDGEKTYLPGDTLVMPEGGFTLTAKWKEGGTYFPLDSCDSSTGWWGTHEIYNGTDSPKEGSGYNGTRGNEVLIFCKIFDSPLDLSAFKETGFIHLWLWVEDETKLNTSSETSGMIDLNDSDGGNYSVTIVNSDLKTGWNDVCIPFSEVVVEKSDLTAITSFRLFQYVTDTTEIRMDGFEVWMPEQSRTISFNGGGADYLLGMNDRLEIKNVVSGAVITLPENLFRRRGYDFCGWSDGNKMYNAGEEYTVPSDAKDFTAIWKESEKYMLTYDYITKTVEREAYPGELITVPSDAVRTGYVFGGWQDGGKIYRPGTTYTMKDKKTTLTAVWIKIDDYDLLSDAAGAWELREGGSAGLAPSAIGGSTLNSKWTVWLNNDTFGQVADFSTEGSCLYTDKSNISLSDRFTLSAWIKAPARENTRRTILSQSGKAGDPVTESEVFFNADSNSGWWGTSEIRIGTGKAAEGSAYLESTGKDILVFCVKFPATDITKYVENGSLTVWIYVEDASSLDIEHGGMVEFSSDGGTGSCSTGWALPTLKNGWNQLTFPISGAVSNKADLSKIDYFRFYQYVTAETTLGLDALTLSRVTQPESSGGWSMYLDEKTGCLAFSADGLSGIKTSGVKLTDGKWHHVAVTLENGKLTYYIDSKAVKTVTVKGRISETAGDLYIGGTSDGKASFDGSIVQVRIYNSAKAPSAVTNTTVLASDNTPAQPRLNTKKGVLIERFVKSGLSRDQLEVYIGEDYKKVDISNVQAAKKFGMDHVKITVTPNNLIDKDGHLIIENMTYVTNDVNRILAEGMPVIFCFHPEPPYKTIYLKDLDHFELLCNWYREAAAYIGEHWTPDQVSIQLMTEPYDNSALVSWTWMSDRMYIAVRNELPDHTIITSSDSSGNIEYLKKMSPVTDSNVIYSFTTYEPYIVGFGSARCGMGGYRGFESFLRNIPYPVPEGLTKSQIAEMADDMCALVPDDLHAEAINIVTAYLSGKYDCHVLYSNNYDIGYTADWQMARMNSLTDWSKKYGGNIHIMCVEFGCMDSVTAKKYFGAVEGSGVTDEVRIRLITDLRTAFEANDIGWSYWLFNGVFTVFDPEKREMDAITDDSYIADAYDKNLIEVALGLTPDYSWKK